MTQTLYLDVSFMSRRDAYYLFYKNYPVLSLVEKNLLLLIQNSDPPLKLVPKKPCQSQLSELLSHLMSKLFGLVVRCLFVSRNGIKMQFFQCSWFQKVNFDYLRLMLLICPPTTKKNIFKFLFPLLNQSSIMISGTEGYSRF